MIIHFLTLTEIQLIQINQINMYGGMHGIRDIKLLDSAVNYPKATFEKKYLLPTIYHMAAGYMHSIIKNHPFVDGNKRTGLISALLFLAYNNIFIEANEDELFEFTVSVAESKIAENDIALFFEQQLSCKAISRNNTL